MDLKSGSLVISCLYCDSGNAIYGEKAREYSTEARDHLGLGTVISRGLRDMLLGISNSPSRETRDYSVCFCRSSIKRYAANTFDGIIKI